MAIVLKQMQDNNALGVKAAARIDAYMPAAHQRVEHLLTREEAYGMLGIVGTFITGGGDPQRMALFASMFANYEQLALSLYGVALAIGYATCSADRMDELKRVTGPL